MAIGWFQWTQYSLNQRKYTIFNDFDNKSFIIKGNTAHESWMVVWSSMFIQIQVTLVNPSCYLANIGVECIETSMGPFIHDWFSIVAFKEIMSSLTMVSEKIAQVPLMYKTSLGMTWPENDATMTKKPNPSQFFNETLQTFVVSKSRDYKLF